jgi:heptosyltransferase-2
MSTTLVVRPGALGDAVLTLPLLSALLARGDRLALLGSPRSWGFLAPGAVALHDLDSRDWLGLFGAEAPLAPAAEAVLAGTPEAMLLLGPQREPVESRLRTRGIRVSVARPPRREDWPAGPRWSGLLPAPLPPGPEHAARRLLEALAAPTPWPPLRGPAECPLLRLSAGESAAALARLGLGERPPEGILAIHPGSGGRAKCWPLERFAALAGLAALRGGLRPLFLLGPAEAGWREALEAALPSGCAPLFLENRPLREALALLAAARCYLGNDSGISHLAARATASLVLFGPSEPRIWHPVGARASVLAAPGGRLEALAVEEVLEALLSLL